MHPRSTPPLRRRARPPLLTAAVAIFSLMMSLFAAAPATAATPADAATALGGSVVKTAAVVGFNPENIISDALFYDGGAMTAAEIQSFLDAKIANTKAGKCTNGKCLNVLSITSDSKKAYYSVTTGNLVCGDLTGGTMHVSEFIYRVQVACGISAKVILVTMQKEQGLVTSTAPSDTELRRAMGHLCSDTAPCESSAAGIANQIFGGAEQLKKYKATNFGKQPSTTAQYIAYSPTASCGGTNIVIRNYATAALYNYTPYQPNAASLAAGYGLGDACSSYGNRNFYNYYTAWFGSTQVDACTPPAASALTAATGEYATTADLNGRAAPTTACTTILKVLPTGTVVTRLATYGEWWQVRVAGTVYWVHSDYLTATPAVTYKTSRVAGDSRYTTAVEVSKAAYPSGASTVFIASGVEFADALTAGASAGAAGASLLLTDGASLLPAVVGELARLKPTRVILVGAENRVSAAVSRTVASTVPKASIERIGGIDRYETSRLLAAEFFPTATSVYVVTGLTYADAVVAAALGGAKRAPVILVDGLSTTADTATLAALESSGAKSIVVAGSAASVSKGIESSLTSAGYSVKRLGGINRYATAALLVADAYPKGAATALVATGELFPDALSGAVLAAQKGGPLFISAPACMTYDVKSWLVSAKVKTLTLIGGTPSLSEAVAASVRC